MPFGKEQNREYQLARYHRMRREAIARAGGKCVQCGDPDELGFEYASGCAPQNPSGELSKIWSRSKEKIERELLRCVLLCRTCRTRKRSTERAEERGHGTITSYKYGCRCDACREVYNAYKRQWRAKQAKSACQDDQDVADTNATIVDESDEPVSTLRACG